jgi:hypothetical protein
MTKALYYPWQDIDNANWLRTACLYWDEIATVVAHGDSSPYKSPETRALQECGVLTPLTASEEHAFRAGSLLREFASTKEWQNVLSKADKGRAAYLIREKRDSWITTDHWTAIYGNFHMDRLLDWRNLRGNIAHLYLTILAGEVSRESGRALVTDMSGLRLLAESVRIGCPLPGTVELPRGAVLPSPHDATRGRVSASPPMQAAVVELALNSIHIDPATPIKKIIDFRNKNSQTLAHFRNLVDKMARELREDVQNGEYSAHSGAMSQAANDKQKDVEVALESLEKQLRARHIETRREWLEIAMLALVPTSVTAPMMGLPSLSLGAATSGIRIAFTVRKSIARRQDLVDSSPYSYLLLARQELSRNKS